MSGSIRYQEPLTVAGAKNRGGHTGRATDRKIRPRGDKMVPDLISDLTSCGAAAAATSLHGSGTGESRIVLFSPKKTSRFNVPTRTGVNPAPHQSHHLRISAASLRINKPRARRPRASFPLVTARWGRRQRDPLATLRPGTCGRHRQSSGLMLAASGRS